MDAKVYSEVFSILQMLGEKYIESIPEEIINTIENSRDKEYQPVYNIDNITKEQLCTDTLSTIAYFNMEFWHEDIDDDTIISIFYD